MKKLGIILVALLVFLSLLAIGCQKKPAPEPQQQTQKLTGVSVDMLAVPKCAFDGMALTDEAIVDTAVYQGKVYGFCAKGEKEQFKADPGKYIAKLESEGEHPHGEGMEEEHPQGKEPMEEQ